MADELKYQSIHTGEELDAAISDIKNGVIEGYKIAAAQSATEAAQSATNAKNSEDAALLHAESARSEANRAEAVAVSTPYLSVNNTWMVWDTATETYKDSGIVAEGTTGQKGDPFVYSDFTPEQLVSLTGPEGMQGPKGDQGIQGEKGETGAIGPQGLKGEKGDIGLTGPKGLQGIQGTKGEQGPQGIQGPKGDKGADGRSLQIEDVYPTLDELKAAFPTGALGAFQVSADMNLYIWSETALQWESIGQLQGPQGQEGPQGIQGESGEQGIAGPQGPIGLTGPKGDTGAQGVQGPQGVQGAQGAKGDTGAVGQNGKSAYQQAKEGGYTGTEAEFKAILGSGPWLPLSGGTVTGPLDMGGQPVEGVFAVRPKYGEILRLEAENSSGYYGLEIDPIQQTLTSGVHFILPTGATVPTPTSPTDAANKQYVDESVAGALPITGGTLTGNLTLKNSSAFGGKINFGDGDYVHLHEISDDKLEIKASNIDLLVSGKATYKGNELSTASVLTFAGKTITVSAWVANSTYSAQGYNFRAAVTCAGVTASYRPDVAFGAADAVSGNFAPVADSYAGGVYIYCKTKPTATVTIPSIVCIKGA